MGAHRRGRCVLLDEVGMSDACMAYLKTKENDHFAFGVSDGGGPRGRFTFNDSKFVMSQV